MSTTPHDARAPLPGAAMLPPTEPTGGTKPPPRKHASRWRFEEINGFADASMAALTRSAIAVWLALWRDTKRNGLARTGQQSLADRAGCSGRAVRTAVKELEAAGLLQVVRKGRLGSGPSVYRVRGANPAHPVNSPRSRTRNRTARSPPRGDEPPASVDAEGCAVRPAPPAEIVSAQAAEIIHLPAGRK